MPISNDLSFHPADRLKAQSPPFVLQKNFPCPLCMKERGQELLRLDDFQCFEDRGGRNRILFRVVFCQECGLIYTDPWLTPDGANWLFEKAGASYGHCDPKERVDWVRRVAPEARSVLDLGCGDGSFPGAFPESFEVTGIESNKHLVARGTVQFPQVRFVQMDMEECDDLPTADVITLFHFLEHVQDPLYLLIQLREKASDATRLVVEVPILDRAIEVQGKDISGFFSIPHRTHFSRETLTAILSTGGWEIVEKTDLQGNGLRVMAQPKLPAAFNISENSLNQQSTLARDYVQCRNASVDQVRKRIEQLPQEGDFLIWGAGHHTEFLVLLTDLFSPHRRFLIVDKDPLKSGMQFHGISVCTPQKIPDSLWKDAGLQVLISTYHWQDAVVQDLKSYGVDLSRIRSLYPENLR